jgi:glutathione synthase/RimK-type ligase-like ATP-grasp enzyme
MRNIVIVECISTGINFIEDIVNRGYNPIVMHLKAPDSEEGKHFDEFIYEEYKNIDYDFDMVFEQDTYEETLDEVRKLDPLLVLPASERGVGIATRLASDLGLLGNPVENIDAMTLKDEMHNRLKECGLRYIRGKVVNSLDEAREFYESENLKEVVIKPISSSCSTSVRICSDKDEMIDALEFLFNQANHYGEKNNELLIQERINGIEYIVNTVSHKGIPRVTLVWKYNKVKTSDGAIIYDSCDTVNKLSLGEAEMVEYAYSVAEAMGIQYGPVHGEYMIDEDGPVLIEVNCRPCGANMPAEYLDRISGQHETDSILDSYLRPKRFFEELKKKYELYAYASLKIFIVPRDIIAQSAPIMNIERKLKSFYGSTLMDIEKDSLFFPKTEDLHSSGGYVFMINEDKAELEKNLNYLRKIERNAFSLIYSEDAMDYELKDDETYLNEIKPLVDQSEKYGTGLLITDQFVEDAKILQMDCGQIDEVKGKFEFILLNLNKSLIDRSESEKVNILFDILSKAKTGGMVFIPKNTYQVMANGRKGVEALIEAMDYEIELPPYNIKDVIIATKGAN